MYRKESDVMLSGIWSRNEDHALDVQQLGESSKLVFLGKCLGNACDQSPVVRIYFKRIRSCLYFLL